MNSVDASKYDSFVDVILPLSIHQSFTYRVPKDLNSKIQIGMRVVVPFKGNRLYTAIVSKVHAEVPINYEAKYLINILDEFPVVTNIQLNFWAWLADYYLCNLGEVMNAAIPSALKLNSESNIVLNPYSDFDKNELSEKEFLIVEAIEIHKSISIQEVQKILDIKTVMPLIKSMIQKGILYMHEEVQEKYSPRTISILELNPFYVDVENLRSLFSELEKKPKQVDLLQAFLNLRRTEVYVTSKMLIEQMGISPSTIQTLVKKGILDKVEQEVSRISNNGQDELIPSEYQLSDEQKNVYQNIIQDQEKNTSLIYGVTSSGKTMVYVELIKKYLYDDKQILILLPEIGLTTQLIERYKLFFKEKIAVYHSKYSDKQRVEIWQDVLNSKTKIVLGTRSSIFLPFQNLGLIIIDEEHDSSYKQLDPNPRYHARDAAIYLATLFEAKVILGSATPSIESYYNAQLNKFNLFELKNRYGKAGLPDIRLIAMQKERMSDNSGGSIGKTLYDALKLRLERKEQSILFQNRRGYAPYLQCNTCGNSPYCINCDVALTYHKWNDELKCHYCGYHAKVMKICQTCGSGFLELKGHGTEKIEDELKELFPEAKVARMDLDTTRKKNAFQDLLSSIELGEVDILVGTQMVTKGLDFAALTLVGIIQADSLINHQDFRAHERAFQLIEQVSGRAGRRDIEGEVIVQTYRPEHPVLQLASRHDYDTFLRHQLNERKQFKYPPFIRMIELSVKHKDRTKTQLAAIALAKKIKSFVPANNVLGPEFPAIGKVRNYYINTILLKLERKNNLLKEQKKLLRNCIIELKANKEFSGLQIVVDVDPY